MKAFKWLVIFSLLCFSNSLYADDVQDIIQAIYKNDIKTVKKILDKGLDPNLRNEKGYEASLMNTACSKNNIKIVKLLLSKGADVNLAGHGNYTPLMWAAESGKTPELVKLLISKGADVKVVGQDGASVLNKAVFGVISDSTSMDTLKFIVDKGVDVNHVISQGPTAGYTSLMVAARWNKIDLAKYLISKGINVNAKAKRGDTALSIAIEEGYKKMAALLKKNGAKK